MSEKEKISQIAVSESNFKSLKQGKKTTVRLDGEEFNLGSTLLVNVSSKDVIKAEITEVRKVRFGDLGLSDAVADGFNSVSELRKELEKCYQKLISDYDVVNVVRFNLMD